MADDDVFAALSDATRRSLVDVLATQGPLSATAMARQYSVTRQAVVKHLGVLAAAGVVVAHRNGNEVLYSVVPRSLDAAAGWLERVGSSWDRRVVALHKHIGSK